ncbi:MAG: ChbG/HpnK family deacetylase [Acidimicrobiia bacterium]|nr:ChbG/HpnK family deacetylase [bacterium]MXX64581.1 ChbG/HpnK family deacetylase [Acidimicrobiia bacterium]MCY3580544.1 ChbG/HpnK family deacetylase [bacterium]MCY3651802.1 ChbG/HpnK family deacetylase [bacterium]MDE0642751.1 ChbG/HpnK family deacetylase [bacterium]
MTSLGEIRAEVIPHIDDIGVTLGSVEAMEELAGQGFVTSGSIMVPCPWFPAAAELANRRPDLDLGLHLTLTSESAQMRWRPMSTSSRTSGLIDSDGYMWATVAELRAHAQPQAVEEELETQLAAAKTAGLELTHLDHHMGGALAPEWAEITLRVARRHGLTVLMPLDPEGYRSVLDLGPAGLSVLGELRDDLISEGGVGIDQFLMGLSYDHLDPASVYKRFLDQATGLTFLSMHCNAPGEVSKVHPGDAAWRIAEYEWVRQGGIEIPEDVVLSDFRSPIFRRHTS